MNAQKYTQKSLEAIQAAQSLALQHQNQQIEQVHLLGALLQQEGGLIPQLLQKMGRDAGEPGGGSLEGDHKTAVRHRFRPGSR